MYIAILHLLTTMADVNSGVLKKDCVEKKHPKNYFDIS